MPAEANPAAPGKSCRCARDGVSRGDERSCGALAARQAKRLSTLPPPLVPLRKERSTAAGGVVGSGMVEPPLPAENSAAKGSLLAFDWASPALARKRLMNCLRNTGSVSLLGSKPALFIATCCWSTESAPTASGRPSAPRVTAARVALLRICSVEMLPALDDAARV